MANFVKAKYHPNIKVAEYIADDGRHLLRSGGSLPWRLCNMGDLVSPVTNNVPSPKKTKGFIGFAKPENSDLHFFIFPDHETGRRELKASLLRMHGNKSLRRMVEKYAPPPKNNPDKYASDLSKLTGIEQNEKIQELSEEKFEKLMEGIARIEGYYADEATQREVWIDVSHIQATDGIRPIVGEEIVVRKDGKETVLKSNSAGQFPPIVNDGGATEIHKKDEHGQLKKIAELPHEKSQRYNLFVKVAEFFGVSGPVKPLEPVISRKRRFDYVVRPNDTLSDLAILFSCSVAEIKKDNQIAKSNIYPGQVLSIYGVPSSKLVRSKPNRRISPSKKDIPTSIPEPQKMPSQASPSKKTAHSDKPSKANQNNTIQERSKEGAGESLALIEPEEGVAPWMKHALAEARHYRGANEGDIEKNISYHKIVKDGKSSLVGTENAWCAAFVNWCLMQAGYPIENPKETGFVDRAAAKGRAHGFMQVRGRRAYDKQKIEEVKFVPNPLFRIIDEPVYGAIAIVTHASGQGHHASFVYGRVRENTLCILGGNQGNTINFMPQNIKAEPAKGNKKAKKDHLVFLLPASYVNPANNSPDRLINCDPAKLNMEIGIATQSNTTR